MYFFCLQFDVHVLLISADKETTPSLEQLHMCCQPTLPVNQLYEVRSSFSLITYISSSDGFLST